MNDISYLQDSSFLRQLDNERIKVCYAKIIVLSMEELPILSIEGRISGGSINIDGSSSVRRTGSITFIAEEKENDLTNIDNIISINKKIRILIGFENNINDNHDKIIWFPQGVFVITQPSITHSTSGVIINLSFKDKMCLLNGECGGNLPTSVTFHEYNQLNENGDVIKVPQRIYDIIQTAVCNYGGEALDKIFVNDIPLEIKQIVRYTGSSPLFYNSATNYYTTNENRVTEGGEWTTFNYNEDIGYIYTDFTYPGDLITNIGDNVCSVLDRVVSALGNYEYFYDINGNFIFQEIKNYLNTSYDPINEYRLDNNRKVEIQTNGLTIIDDTNYFIDFNGSGKSFYTFEQGNGLITSYSNTPSYTNMKNDFHIWGTNNDGLAIHYHLVIKEKPNIMNTYSVTFLTDDKGQYSGALKLATGKETYNKVNGSSLQTSESTYDLNTLFINNNVEVNDTKLLLNNNEIELYTPDDWRAELYLQGLTKQQLGIRPNIYEQELLDLFDSIYNFKEKKFKADIVNNPNELNYFIDYLEPASNFHDCSVDSLKTKIYSYQQDKINKLYNLDIPDVILLDLDADISTRIDIIDRCEKEGQPYSNIEHNIYSQISIGTTGYSAQETARELLYQYTNYNESITIQAIPIYYFDVNKRITVRDLASGIYGDYIVKSISLSLDAQGTMSISATRALERI